MKTGRENSALAEHKTVIQTCNDERRWNNHQKLFMIFVGASDLQRNKGKKETWLMGIGDENSFVQK